MRRQWTNSTLGYSTLPEAFRQNQTYSQSNFIAYTPNISRERLTDKSTDRSRGKRIISQQELDRSIRMGLSRMPESLSSSQLVREEAKEDNYHRQIEAVLKRVRELEGRMTESQHKVQVLQRNNKNTTQLTTSLEEFMRNQYAEIKDRENLEDRINTFEQALGHLSMVKADRKELENIEGGKSSILAQKYNQLQRYNEKNDKQIKDLGNKFQRMLGKIETSFLQMGQKYEQFIESNVIDTVEQVNKMTQQYQQKFQELKKEQLSIWQNVEQLKLEVTVDNENKNSKDLVGFFGGDLIGVSLPNIRIVQTLSIQQIREEKKTKLGLNGLKSHIKEQHKDAYPLSQSGSTYNSENLTPNMFQSFDNSSPPAPELFFDKVIYKLDKDFNLLDENDRYLLQKDGSHVKLSFEQISMLKEHKILA